MDQETSRTVKLMEDIRSHDYDETLFQSTRYWKDDQIIDHQTTYAGTEAHDIQLYQNTPTGYQGGMGAVTGDKQEATGFLLHLLHEGVTVHDLSWYQGSPSERCAAWLGHLADHGWSTDHRHGTVYDRHQPGMHLTITETCHEDGLRTIEASEITPSGPREIAQYGTRDPEQSLVFIRNIMEHYMGRPIAELRQHVLFRHEHGYRTLAQRGTPLRADDIAHLQELYVADRLYVGDKEAPVAVSTLTNSLEDLLR